MKQTIWKELPAKECKIVETYIPEGGTIEGGSIMIKHPLLKRARLFTYSKKGNWYSRYTGKGNDAYAEGFIVKGELEI